MLNWTDVRVAFLCLEVQNAGGSTKGQAVRPERPWETGVARLEQVGHWEPIAPAPQTAVFRQHNQMLHFPCLISVKLHDLFLKLKKAMLFFLKPQELSLGKPSKDFINS